MTPPHSTSANSGPILATGHESHVQGFGTIGLGGLQEIAAFGSNPGALRAWAYVPPGLSASAPLVVVLHGCTQKAADYDTGAGWSQLADELGFMLLLPEQQRGNNSNLCFNWFSPGDSRRDSGEALSIRQMIAWMAQAYDIDEQRVFVTGLSAGGAMTSIMLATYPELFAGGAIIAGMPFGAAGSIGDALSRMAGQGYPPDAELATLVREASAHDGPWPPISVWQGSADRTVHPSNADRIIAQWRPLYEGGAEFSEAEPTRGHIRRMWRNPAGQVVLEQHIITGMGHGTPLETDGPDGCGHAGPYMLDVGVSSSRAIAQSWGLDDGKKRQSRAANDKNPFAPANLAAAIPQVANGILRRDPIRHPQRGVGSVIEEALRAVGLMR